MTLHLTNTLTGQKEQFIPLVPGKVSLYVCGVTVYDQCHIGHARGAVVFDVLRRYLEQHYSYQVNHVRNITDVDDKIIDRARSEGGTDLKAAVSAVAREYEASFQDDFSKLGLVPPTHEPRATEYIPKIIRFIEELLKRGIAYEGSDGVYFSVRKIENYGPLSHQKLDQMMEGVRSVPGEGKEDPLDFALWKKAKLEEPSWESPWGAGRPGWHIECSTMSTDLLGDTFDIHGGGQDLIFPHHENELAQARGAGKPFARYWVHNGLLTVNGQKMSKSIGNVVSIQEALKRHPHPDVLRLFFLSAHYRSPMDFTWERYDEAARAYERLITFMSQTEPLDLHEDDLINPEIERQKDFFYKNMDDDINTPLVLSALYKLVDFGYERKKKSALIDAAQAAAMIEKLSDILGFSILDNAGGYASSSSSSRSSSSSSSSSDFSEEVEKMITERDEARLKKDFKKSDEIRKQLIEMGYIVEDTPDGTVVRRHV